MRNKKYLSLIGLMIFVLACFSENGLNIIRSILPFVTHILIVSGMAFVLLYGLLMILDENGTKKKFFNLKKIRKQLAVIGLMILILMATSVDRENTTERILPYLMHLLILLGILFMALHTFLMIIHTNNFKETLLKFFGLLLSFLIYYIAILLDFSISDLVLQSIKNSNSMSLIMINFISPLILGFVVAFFINKTSKQRNLIANQGIIMLSTLIIILFVDIYLAVEGVKQNIYLLPNVGFTIGLMLYIIIGYEFNNQLKLDTE